MIELASYRIGFWTGQLTEDDLTSIWKDMGTLAEYTDQEDMARLFPNGWVMDQFKSGQAKTKLVDPLTMDVKSTYRYQMDYPADFVVDMGVLLEWFKEDPNLVWGWGDWDMFFEQGTLPGQAKDHDLAVHIDALSLFPSHESGLGHELDNMGPQDTFEPLWEDIVPDLVRRHELDYVDRDNPRPNLGYMDRGMGHLGFWTFQGVLAFDLTWGKDMDTWAGPGDYWMDMDYLGIVDWRNVSLVRTVEGGQKDQLSFPVGQAKEGPVRPRRSILDLKK